MLDENASLKMTIVAKAVEQLIKAVVNETNREPEEIVCFLDVDGSYQIGGRVHGMTFSGLVGNGEAVFERELEEGVLKALGYELVSYGEKWRTYKHA